NM
ncbi:oxaloacetate decarboxylase beta chain, partial [Vibrio parahaemolyticus EKP-008]